MAANLSMDLRERIVAAYDCGNVSCCTVGARFGVAASTVGKLVNQARTEKCLKPRYNRCGRNVRSPATQKRLWKSTFATIPMQHRRNVKRRWA